MQNRLNPELTHSTDATTSTAPVGRYIRWQALIALTGILLLSILLGVSAYQVSTTLVPDRGGVFREGVAGNPQHLNPLLCQTHEVDEDICALIFRGLTKLDKQGQVVADLAESWSVTPDGLTYTFRLNPNQLWHDGQPVTIDDVLFTVEALQSQDSPVVPDLAELWQGVTVERVDEFTVRFTLEQAFAPFLDYTSIGLLPKHIWDGVPFAELASSPLNATPVGTGPLRVASVAADAIRLEPNPFDEQATPYISALEFRFYPDYPSIFAAYTRDEIDGISRVLPADLPVAMERDDLQLFSAMESVYLNVVFNLRNPDVPFLQEKPVRQALYYAIDRERLVSDAVAGQGIVADTPIPGNNWAYSEDVRKYDYNPDLARQLLTDNGWIDQDGDGIREKDGQALRFILLSNDDPTRQAVIKQIAEDWRAIGVLAEPQAVSFAGLVSDFLAPRHFDAALIGWEISGDPDPFPLWHSSQADEGGQNYSGWSNAEADELMRQARASTDYDIRRQIYAQFQRVFAEDLPALPLYYPVYTYGVSQRIKNVQIGPLNRPADRFATFPEWYIVTRRVPANQIPADAPPTPPGQSSGQADPQSLGLALPTGK
jgi:peptide/nickel transport system substrate-binding protein